jgi:hypothetical protein
MEDDGLYLPEIRAHSLEKLRRHNFYATIFSKAMARKWRHRVYIGLYAGAGRAIVRGTGEVVETSALAVVRQEVPFTKYIFVDSDPRCTTALADRRAMPAFNSAAGEGLLALCFVDPFRVDLDFDVIRQLSRFKIDFLVMLPFGFDLRRNLRRYLENEEDDRVGRMIDAPGWREEWRRAGRADRYFVRFAIQKFDEAMARLGFRPRDMRDTVPVKVTGMGVYLYSLALYTRHELGEQFWKTTLARTNPQFDLGI